MVNIPVARSTFKRDVTRSASIALLNRFFEQNPVLNASDDLPALVARAALKKFGSAGEGHIRFTFDEPGTFDDASFVVSAGSLYKLSAIDLAVTYIGELGTNPIGSISMAAVGNIGETPERLFIADGGVLWVYTDDGEARGHLEATGAIANNDTVVIDGIYYKWTNASVDAGTPAGTAGSPWLVALGLSNSAALQNLYNAVNATGEPGADYSTALEINPDVQAYAYAANDLYVSARVAGIIGNGIAVSETGANIAWTTGANLVDGGDPQLRQVTMPDDVGAISIDVLNSYVIVVPVQGRGVNGQFWWIEPGETTVDPLNFATAERSPDAILQVRVFSDRFWLLGQKTTEPWITTGNLDAPMQRFAGVLYDRGTWEGTAVKVKDSLITVDEDGAVFQIGGGLKRVSRPDIEERIRRAMQRQTGV
jgi:hypothetical protein